MDPLDELVRRIVDIARTMNNGSIEIIINKPLGFVDLKITERIRVIEHGAVLPQVSQHKHYRKKS
ncbi:hypothetical protein AGMMS49944_24090 [Spirochaetia bacterium]|nr:hypothetical protein AGMMS49944_24090 [Spirochaetia bacterium]